jgi:hypothetical protein
MQETQLLEFLGGGVVADQIFENGEDVLAILHDFFKDGPQLGSADGFLVPFGQDGGGDLDIAAQFFGGVAAQKEAVEKSGFALGELKIQQRLFDRVGDGGHDRNRSLPISLLRSSVHGAKNVYKMPKRATTNQKCGTEIACGCSVSNEGRAFHCRTLQAWLG